MEYFEIFLTNDSNGTWQGKTSCIPQAVETVNGKIVHFVARVRLIEA